MTLRVALKTLSPTAVIPEYFSAGAAGMDLAASLPSALQLNPGDVHLVPCGFAMAIPTGYEGQVRPRSGLASKHGVTVLNAPGTIDSDYRGEVKVLLVNHGRQPLTIEPGMRIAQLVIAPVTRVEWDVSEELPQTVRAEGGFGHTG